MSTDLRLIPLYLSYTVILDLEKLSNINVL